MGLSNSYRTLFDIRLLHRYFLDEYNNEYVESGGGTLQTRFDNNRLKFNLANIMTIQPTLRTQKVLKNYNGLFRSYKDGFKVALKEVPGATPLPQPFIPFDSNFYLDFTIEIIDSVFENYTDIEWDKNGLVYLSNLDPTLYTPGSEDEPPAVSVNFSRLSEYETQNSGTDININLLKDVQAAELIGKFGIIRIYLEGEPSEMQLVDSSDATKFNNTTPELDIYLRNRSTVWRFKNVQDQSVIYETNNTRPLTQNGYRRMPPANAGINARFPNPEPKIIVWDTSEEEFYSDVYVKF